MTLIWRITSKTKLRNIVKLIEEKTDANLNIFVNKSGHMLVLVYAKQLIPMISSELCVLSDGSAVSNKQNTTQLSISVK